jgi:hypothetical protein
VAVFCAKRNQLDTKGTAGLAASVERLSKNQVSAEWRVVSKDHHDLPLTTHLSQEPLSGWGREHAPPASEAFRS